MTTGSEHIEKGPGGLFHRGFLHEHHLLIEVLLVMLFLLLLSLLFAEAAY